MPEHQQDSPHPEITLPHKRLLEGNTALITGGSRGIGKSIGIEYARFGVKRIYFVSRGDTPEKEAEAIQTAQEITTLGAEAIWIKADVSKDKGIQAVISKLEVDRTSVGVLVNNAGYTFDALAELNSPELLDASYNLNLRAPVLLASQMKARGLFADGASVIFNASIIGKFGNTGQINYAAMKAGILGVTKTLAEEWGPEGIRVNTIYPGFVPTELTSNVPNVALQILEDITPLNRLGTPEDIAGVAVFLASPLSAFVTGAGIDVDGGLGGKAPAGFSLYYNHYRRLTAKQMKQLGIE